MHVCVCGYIYMCVCVCVIYMSVCVRVYTCIYIHIYTEILRIHFPIGKCVRVRDIYECVWECV